jgi:hypothetical protein
MRTSILMTAACLTAGCYNYSPLATPTPEAGTYVAVTLTSVGSQDLARYLGPSVFVVRGRYLRESDDGGLVVSVSSVERQRGDELPWAGENVALPNSAIASLEVRRLARGRSLLLAGVGAGGLVATTLAFALIGGGTQPGPGRGPPPKQ